MIKDSSLQIGVIGVGHLGYFHLKQLSLINNINIAGIFDVDKKRLNEVSQLYSVKPFTSLEDLLIVSDAVTIVTPTPTHYNIAQLALNYGCHIFIEKPITNDILDAKNNGYSFFWESLYLLNKKKYSIKEIPIYLPYRQVGSSKMTMGDIIGSLLYLFKYFFKNLFS